MYTLKRAWRGEWSRFVLTLDEGKRVKEGAEGPCHGRRCVVRARSLHSLPSRARSSGDSPCLHRTDLHTHTPTPDQFQSVQLFPVGVNTQCGSCCLPLLNNIQQHCARALLLLSCARSAASPHHLFRRVVCQRSSCSSFPLFLSFFYAAQKKKSRKVIFFNVVRWLLYCGSKLCTV